jgi:acyl-coenzyme A thioesterase PaaI-like protein
VFGFKLHSLARGERALVIPFQPDLERPGGIVAVAVFMAAADVAMWLAIMTHLGKEELTVSVELNTSSLSAAKEEDARCTARVLKLGKRLIYGVAECCNLAGKLLTCRRKVPDRHRGLSAGPGLRHRGLASAA